MERRRRPRWVYEHGSEPDARFSLANERTFLAWIRTALALIVAGVVIDVVPWEVGAVFRTVIATALIGLGATLAVGSWWWWAITERAVRQGRPLPSPALGLILAPGLLVIAIAVVVGLWW